MQICFIEVNEHGRVNSFSRRWELKGNNIFIWSITCSFLLRHFNMPSIKMQLRILLNNCHQSCLSGFLDNDNHCSHSKFDAFLSPFCLILTTETFDSGKIKRNWSFLKANRRSINSLPNVLISQARQKPTYSCDAFYNAIW